MRHFGKNPKKLKRLMSSIGILGILAVGLVLAFAVAGLWLQKMGRTRLDAMKQHESPAAQSSETAQVAPTRESPESVKKTTLTKSSPTLLDNSDQPVSPVVDASDQLLESSAYVEPDFPDTPLGLQLRAHMYLMEGVGPNAEASYQASLEELRQYPDESTALLFDAYNLMDPERYYDRWKVVNALGALEIEEALEALTQIAEEPMPEHYLFSDELKYEINAAGEEALIRAAAVRGVEYQARNGVIEAKTSLFDLVAVDDPYVRKVAVLAYRDLAENREHATERIKEILPAEDYWMLDINTLATPPATDFRDIGESEVADLSEADSFRQIDPTGDNPPPMVDTTDEQAYKHPKSKGE